MDPFSGRKRWSGCYHARPGFLHNNFMRHFNPMPNHWNSMVPGKRMKGGAQTMLFYGGRPFMAFGKVGKPSEYCGIPDDGKRD